MARPGLHGHRKFRRLARTLGSPILARGVLELLWDSCYECGDDYVGTAEDIEAMIGWTGEPGLLTRALVSCGAPEGHGFIEPTGTRNGSDRGVQYVVHDLWHHAPDYVAKRRRRELERLDKVAPIRSLSAERRRTAPTSDCPDEVDRTPSPSPSPSPSPGGKSVSSEAHAPAEPDADATRGAVEPRERARTRATTPSRASGSPARPEVTQGLFEAREHPTTRAVTVPRACDDSPITCVFPTVGQHGTEWRLRSRQVEEWQGQFPGLDVRAEMAKALAWIVANPERRKTTRGMPRFCVNWLTRATDRSTGGPARAGPSGKTAGNLAAAVAFIGRGRP